MLGRWPHGCKVGREKIAKAILFPPSLASMRLTCRLWGHHSPGLRPFNTSHMENESLHAQFQSLLNRLSQELMDLHDAMREAESALEEELRLQEMARMAREMERLGWEGG